MASMPIDAYFRGLFQMVAKPISEFKQADLTGDAPKGVIDEKNPRHDVEAAGPDARAGQGRLLPWRVARLAAQGHSARGRRTVHDHASQSGPACREWPIRTSRRKSPEPQARACRRHSWRTRRSRLPPTPGPQRFEQAKRLLIDWAEGNGCTVALDANGGIRSIMLPRRRVGAMIDAKFAEYDEMKKQARARASEKFAASNAKIKALNEATLGQEVGILWSDIARQLGTDAGKTRTFSGLIPAAGSASSTYARI